jgi:uncharacterized membrane protein
MLLDHELKDLFTSITTSRKSNSKQSNNIIEEDIIDEIIIKEIDTKRSRRDQMNDCDCREFDDF